MNKEIKSADVNGAMALDAPAESFVAAMAAAAFGVSIVTTDGNAGRYGLTVSAVSSVSAEPPLLLACINRKNLVEQAITKNQRFVVNLLSDQQSALAKMFAGRPEQGEAYDFGAAKWTKEHGMPVLQGAAANFVCNLESYSDAGTHRIFIGRVIHAMHNGALPLVYSHRTFGKFVKL
jgi:flavin reductase (DIM6/NTAB) family NADH-FMN oxidoreductase RutF